jgi:hypothetical protein
VESTGNGKLLMTPWAGHSWGISSAATLLTAASAASVELASRSFTGLSDEQIEKALVFWAEALRTYGEDLLRGDFTIFDGVKALIQERSASIRRRLPFGYPPVHHRRKPRQQLNKQIWVILKSQLRFAPTRVPRTKDEPNPSTRQMSHSPLHASLEA